MQVKHHISDFAYHPSFRNVSREKLHYCCMPAILVLVLTTTLSTLKFQTMHMEQG
jgi:hypothetical protein